MCILVDANAAHKVHAQNEDGAAVLKWLLRGPGKLVVSNEILAELRATPINSIIMNLGRAGKLIRVEEVKCENIKSAIIESGLACSNDVHIIAAVLEASCDLVFTHDKPLHRDLKNRNLVPRGCAIYQTVAHRDLLGLCSC